MIGFPAQRLAVQMILVIGAALLLFSSVSGFFTYRYVYKEEIRNADLLLTQLAMTVQAQAEVAVYARNNEIATGVLGGLLANPLILAVRIVGEDDFHVELGSRHEIDNKDSRRYLLYSPINRVEPIGHIDIIRNEVAIKRLAAQAAWLQATLMLVQIMIVMLLLAIGLRWRIITPITRLAHVLAKIQPGSSERIPLDAVNAGNEIGVLTQRTNAMLDAAQHAVRVVREKEQSKSKFFAAVSHDLRQPIQAINLFLEALKLAQEESERTRLIHSIERSSKALTDNFNELLDISRLDSGMVQAQCEWISVEDFFLFLDQSFSAQAIQQRLRFKLWYPRQALALHTDRRMLNAIFTNLTGNALKHTTRGGVLVSLRRRGDACVIQVWDTGCGITGEHLAHIFEEFYQADNPNRDSTKGYGLGLAIARRTAALLGYELSCRSQPGKGSVFEVRLPAGVLKAHASPSDPAAV